MLRAAARAALIIHFPEAAALPHQLASKTMIVKNRPRAIKVIQAEDWKGVPLTDSNGIAKGEAKL